MVAFKARNTRLDWIEAGRGIAAAMVVFSHIKTTHAVPVDWLPLGLFGTFGVAYFFVLSGFLMLHIHRNDINQPGSFTYFLWRRLVRIMPAYWVAFLLLLSINLVLQKSDYRISPTPQFLVGNLFILPGIDLFLGPSWTLRDELFFYAMFSCIILNRKLGLTIFAVWFSIMVWRMIAIGIWTGPVYHFPDVYIHHANLYFFVGLGVALAELMGWLRNFIIGGIAAAVVLLGLAATPLVHDNQWMIALGEFPAFGALLGVTVALSGGTIRAPRILTWMGKISFSLYLTHLAVFIVLRGVDNRFGRPLDAIWPVRVAIQLIAAVGFAALMNMLVEQPVLNWAARQKTLFGLSIARKRVAQPA